MASILNRIGKIDNSFSSDELLDNNESIHHKEVKTATNYLVNSYKQGRISEDVFENLIETLLAYYIEQRLENKIIKKIQNSGLYFSHLK